MGDLIARQPPTAAAIGEKCRRFVELNGAARGFFDVLFGLQNDSQPQDATGVFLPPLTIGHHNYRGFGMALK